MFFPPPPPEDVAHLIHLDFQVDLTEPAHEQVPGPLVLVGEGQPLHAAAGGGADLGHLFEAAPQPGAVDAQVCVCHVASWVSFVTPIMPDCTAIDNDTGFRRGGKRH